MGRGIQRIGDANNGGGVILGPGQPNVRVNNRPISKPGDKVTPHAGCPKQPQHCSAFTTGIPGSRSVRANGQPLVLTGDPDSCITHSRLMGSTNVKVG